MSNWRTTHSVLVTEAHAIGSLAAIRSLGQAGYRVIASSPQAKALGFYSAYCHRKSIQPPYSELEQFSTWLDDVLVSERVELIIPSESFLLAIRSRFAELHSLLPVPADKNLVYQALSKWDLFQACRDKGLHDHLPPFYLADNENAFPTPTQLREMGEPLYLKCDGVHGRDGNAGAVIRCQTAEIAHEQLKTLWEQYRKILVQGYVPGVGVGAFQARWKGRWLGKFMHRRIHEVPHSGGASSFRAAWRHAAIMADADERAEHLGWEGVGMWEYRWDQATDRFYLMEFNSRFWGSLHLAMFAGVDFPRLLADAFFGQPNSPVTDYAMAQCRLTYPREVEYVASCLKDPMLPWSRKLFTILEFARLGLDPRVYSDLNYPGDRALYWRMMIRSFRRFLS